MELIAPSTEYKASFIDAVKELKADTEFSEQRGWLKDVDTLELEADFESFVEREKSQANGENLPTGYVPQTNFWLVDNGEFIGAARIRHRLNEHLERIGGHIGYVVRPTKRRQGYGSKIFELVLPKVKELGITHVLLTCDVTNTASSRIIQKNGGVFESQVTNAETGVDKARYWIDVKI